MSALADTLAALAQSDLLPRLEQAIAEDRHR